jgi:hypothetical protein
MPPEQDDERARQLEALRRYVAVELARRSRPERQRPSLLLTGLLVTVALVAGVLVGAMPGRAAGPPAATRAPAPRPPRGPYHHRRAGRFAGV